jgi:hypothetical protein
MTTGGPHRSASTPPTGISTVRGTPQKARIAPSSIGLPWPDSTSHGSATAWQVADGRGKLAHTEQLEGTVAERSKYGIWWSLGWPYEMSACMARLVYSGVFDTYPGLRVITHHAGAMVPHFAGRLASPLEDPGRAEILAGLKRDYFRGFYADTAMFGAAHAVRCAVEFFRGCGR